MDIKFRPPFFRDLKKISDESVKELISTSILNIKSAHSLSQIHNLKKLKKYNVHYRIKIKLDNKKNYRIGLIIRGKTVWLVRALHRNKIYKEFPDIFQMQ